MTPPPEKKKAPVMQAPPPCYVMYYQTLKAVADEHDYALAVHGSMVRDFDLVAIPWHETASHPADLILAFKKAVGGVFTKHDFDHIGTVMGNATIRPHGRMTWCLHLTDEGMYGPYLDISVMPRILEENNDS